MIIGQYAFAELEYNYSVPNPFSALLNNPEAQLIYLIELYPYDAALPATLAGSPPLGATAFGEVDVAFTGGLTKIYLSDAGFVTEPTDTPPSKYFVAQVNNPLQFETSIISQDGFSGGSQSFGALTIHNGNGELDYLDRYYWSNHRIVVKAGSRDFSYNQFATVFDGAVNGIEADDDTITLTIQDNKIKTDQLIQAGVYQGTGGLEGSSDLANTPKPLCYGVVKNIEPVLVNGANLIYQLHDGEISAIDAIRDSGIALTSAGNVANISSASPPAGQYYTQLTGGYFRLGSTPAGRITADAHGESAGGFVSTAAAIVLRILTTRLGTTSLTSSEIDTGSLNRLTTVLAGDMGVFITDKIPASDVIDQLITASAAYWTFTRSGQLFVGAVASPGASTATITSDVIDESGIKIAQNIAPAWRISVGYAPSFVVQGDDELAGATDTVTRAYIGQQYRYVTLEDRSVKAKNAQAGERTFNTNLANKTDAEALLNRLSAIYSVKRRVYQVPVYRGLFRLFLGDTVKLVYDRFDLQAGKNLLVVGISEDVETGQTTLSLWG